MNKGEGMYVDTSFQFNNLIWMLVKECKMLTSERRVHTNMLPLGRWVLESSGCIFACKQSCAKSAGPAYSRSSYQWLTANQGGNMTISPTRSIQACPFCRYSYVKTLNISAYTVQKPIMHCLTLLYTCSVSIFRHCRVSRG